MASISRAIPGLQRGRWASLDAVYIAAALVLLGLRPLLTPVQPHDFWWHTATGRLIVERGAIPMTDQFSWTQAGQPFFNQSWLAQLMLYGLQQLGGVPLIVLVQSLVLLGTYGLLLRLCIERSGRVRLSVALLLLATLPLSFDNWNVRPQSYALPCFVGFLVVLTNYRLQEHNQRFAPRGWLSDYLWLLPLLMVLWVNLHGSFVLGGGLIALTLLGEGLKRLLGYPALSWGAWVRLFVWAGITAIAVLLNPQGWGVLGYVRNLLGSSQVTQLVTEWAPPNIRDPNGLIFFAFVLCSFVLLALARKRPDPTDVLLYVAFLWLGLSAVRNIVWFGLVATPLLVVQAATLLSPPRRTFVGNARMNGLLIGLLLLLYTTGLPWVKPLLWPPTVGALLSSATPVDAVAFLRTEAQRPTRIFNEMGYGSYLIWTLPAQRVFIDPRIELYPYQQWLDYIAFNNGEQVEQLIEQYRIDGLLLSKQEQAGLIAEVRALPAWEQRYEDNTTVYFRLSR